MNQQVRPDDSREAAFRCFEAGNYGVAVKMLAPLLAECPGDPVLLRLCGMAMVRTGAAVDGLPHLARAAMLAPDDPLSATWHGIGLHAIGRPVDAARVLQLASTLAPGDPAPLIHLSRALLEIDRPRDALDAARRAVSLAPRLLEAEHAACLSGLAVLREAGDASPADLAEAWLSLGRTCMRLDKAMDARSAFIEALGLQPLHEQAACELALVEHLCGQPVAATARLRSVLDRDAGCVAARLALASRLLLADEAGSALDVLEMRRAPPPGELRARWHAERAQGLIALGRDEAAARELGQAERPAVPALELLLTWQRLVLALRARHPEADALADRVERLTRVREAGTLEQRIDTHFDLAALHHTASRHDAAFAHWTRGHRLLGLAQPFSREGHDRYLAAITQSFDAFRLAEGPRAGTNDPVPVFIVGLPRTGTTLLEQILSAHHAVHGAGERLAVRETLVRLTGTTMAGSAMTQAATLDAATLTAASRDFLEELHALAPRAARVLDKMPDNIFQLGFIATLLPGARIIVCTRDLRDVGASIFQHRFIGHHPYAHDLADLGWYMTAQQRLLAHWQTSLPLPMLVLDHCEWIEDFDATVRRVLTFLDLPYDPACLRFFEQDRRVESASRAQVRRPINAAGVGRWRTYADQLGPMLRALAEGG